MTERQERHGRQQPQAIEPRAPCRQQGQRREQQLRNHEQTFGVADAHRHRGVGKHRRAEQRPKQARSRLERRQQGQRDRQPRYRRRPARQPGPGRHRPVRRDAEQGHRRALQDQPTGAVFVQRATRRQRGFGHVHGHRGVLEGVLVGVHGPERHGLAGLQGDGPGREQQQQPTPAPRSPQQRRDDRGDQEQPQGNGNCLRDQDLQR